MKNKIFKFIKVFSGIILFLLLTIVLAILCPMPQLKPPTKHNTVFIKSINIIDVKSGNILENRDILIKDNVIIAIDTIGILKAHPTSLIIDGTNKYLMPGLWDMHTHSNQHSEWLHHPLFIANGVTGIRDMSGQLNKRDSYWAGSKERLIWNAELSDNKRVTPRYVLQSSYQIDGAPSVPDGFPEFFKLQKSEDVDSLLRFYKNEKVDFIKVYQEIPPESYKKLALQAPNYGMHLAGHKPIFTSLEDAILLGQRSFEHGRIFLYESFPNADSLRTSDNWKKFFSESRESMVKDYNPEVATRLMLLMKEHNTYWTPTLQSLKFEAFAHEPTFLENPNLKYITYIRKKLWWDIDVGKNKKRNLSQEGKNISADFYNAAKEQIKIASEIGVPIMTGTDVTDSYVFPGFSIHDELEDLTKSGLSNLKALQSATIIPAEFAQMEKDYGTVENGKIADLIILNKNPLENITNSKTINGVILNGIYYDVDKIEELKNYTQSVASSFHMNAKVFYSLIASPLIRLQFFAD
ncbi:MAG TPA: amidohydrolase family protein [Parachlamydiaceae bacterium]|nr:amidohydrolase family protein [Parachlamydiaceae bacterium]